MKKILAGFIACGAVLTSQMSQATLLVSDGFTYASGSITNNSGGVWESHSGGAADDATINGNALELQGGRTTDVNINLGSTFSSGTLYYGFRLRVDAAPTGADRFFAHLLQSTANFRDRLFTTTNGVAGAGLFRLGISNGGTLGATWASDLSTGTTYQIVVRANLDTDETALWVDPVTEASLNITQISATANTVDQFAFRQSTGIGNNVVDDLAVADTFTDIVPVPEPTTMGLMGLGVLGALIARRKRA